MTKELIKWKCVQIQVTRIQLELCIRTQSARRNTDDNNKCEEIITFQ